MKTYKIIEKGHPFIGFEGELSDKNYGRHTHIGKNVDVKHIIKTKVLGRVRFIPCDEIIKIS